MDNTSPKKSHEGQRGLECRVCGCKHLRVVYTRSRSEGKLVRRRECRHCGTRMTTCERAIG
jgi:transcriptional regulator NrdR family protein